MASNEEILQIIYSSIDDLNKTLSEDEQLSKAPDQIIIGENSTLDSLGFVNFVVDLEDKLNSTFDLELTLTDEDLMMSEDTPFRNVDVLSKYLATLINE